MTCDNDVLKTKMQIYFDVYSKHFSTEIFKVKEITFQLLTSALKSVVMTMRTGTRVSVYLPISLRKQTMIASPEAA